MSPVSPDRPAEIDAELYLLTRTIQVLQRDGARVAVSSFNLIGPSAQELQWKAINDLQMKKLQLLAERQAIAEHFRDNPND